MRLRQRPLTKDEQELLDSFLSCRHPLFKEETSYVICPSCGEFLKENLPQHSQDRARLYLIRRKLRSQWLMKTNLVSTAFVFGVALFLPTTISFLILHFQDYGFKTFFLPRYNHHGMMPITFWGYFPLFVTFLGGERFKRSLFFSCNLECLYKIWYFWPIRLIIFTLVFTWVNSYGPPLFEDMGQEYMARHDYLTQAQRDKGVELFVFINMLSIWIASVMCLLFQLFDYLKTQRFKKANEVYLSGGS